MTANRLAGLFVVLASVLFWLFVIPYHTSAASSGWMRPRTLPTICAITLIALGLLLAVFPKGITVFSRNEMLPFCCIFAMAVASAWGISRFGFLAVGPVFGAALMLFVGERRLLWLISGVILAPATIWFVTTVLLGRPLP